MKEIKIDIKGQSRTKYIDIYILNFNEDFKINKEDLQSFVDRRKASKNIYSTPRQEEDKIEYIKGFKSEDEKTFKTTKKMHFRIYNKDVKKDNITELESPIFRPSHADFVSYFKYGKVFPGGGMFSARVMIGLAIAGGIAKQILNSFKIRTFAYISQIGKTKAKSYIDTEIKEEPEFLDDKFRLLDNNDKNELFKEIEYCFKNEDSVGGKIECVALNVPLGLGSYQFMNFESKLSQYIFSVPAIKALEFGLGTAFCDIYGSKANDELYLDGSRIKTYTNNNGGINGGITNSMPITFTTTLKPTSSIAKKLRTVQANPLRETFIELKGRNDVCIVPRAVVLIESCMNLTLLDFIQNKDEIHRKEMKDINRRFK